MRVRSEVYAAERCCARLVLCCDEVGPRFHYSKWCSLSFHRAVWLLTIAPRASHQRVQLASRNGKAGPRQAAPGALRRLTVVVFIVMLGAPSDKHH